MHFTIAIFVSSLVSVAVGSLWYSKFGFMKAWLKATGMTQEEAAATPKSEMNRAFALNFLGELLMAYVLGYFIVRMGTETVPGALEITTKLWLGIVLPIFLAPYLWEKKSFSYLLLGIGYRLVSMSAIAITLGLFF